MGVENRQRPQAQGSSYIFTTDHSQSFETTYLALTSHSFWDEVLAESFATFDESLTNAHFQLLVSIFRSFNLLGQI